MADKEEKKNIENNERKRKQLANVPSSSSHQENEFYAPLTAEEARNWQALANTKGLSEPHKLGMVKVVTVTDAKKDQNRWEMGPDDFSNSMALLELAVRAHTQEGSQLVTVFDRKCREYRIEFAYIPSNAKYRFRGSEWGKFMKQNRLEAEQIMRIYGLTDDQGKNYGFAFINSSQ